MDMLNQKSEIEKLEESVAGTHIDEPYAVHALQTKPNPLLTKRFIVIRYAIYNLAVNSSGDVYHIAAYLMLCRAFHWIVPKVYLGYDSDDTKTQAERSKNFLNLLGFENDCSIMQCDRPSSTYTSPRDSAARKALQDKKTNAIDQKMTTALIAYAQLKYGHQINSVLKNGFLIEPQLRSEEYKQFSKWLKTKMTQVIRAVRGHLFVVIHHRISQSANSGQSLPHITIKAIIQFLEKYSIKVFLLRVSDKEHKTHKKIINVFENVDGLPDKYDKFRHVQLLQAIDRLPNFLGIIGGTSGTLDVAAFMGIRVLNIHTFNDATYSNDKIIPAQDYRILLQTQLMTVCKSKSTVKPNGMPDDQTSRFLSWWLSTTEGLRFPLFLPEKRGTYVKNDNDQHQQRISFKYCLINNTKENVVPIKRTSGTFNVAHTNRFFNQQNDWLEYSLKISECIPTAGNTAGITPTSARKHYSNDDINLLSKKPASNPTLRRLPTYESPF